MPRRSCDMIIAEEEGEEGEEGMLELGTTLRSLGHQQSTWSQLEASGFGLRASGLGRLVIIYLFILFIYLLVWRWRWRWRWRWI